MKIVRSVSFLIVLVALLSVYSYFVVLAARDGGRPGTWQKPLLTFSTFVETALQVFTSNEIRGLPPTYVGMDRKFEEMNKLDYDLYALNAHFNRDETRWDIRLVNLRNDSLHHQWYLDKDVFFRKNNVKQFDRSPPRNSIMLADRSLLVDLDGSNNLLRIDAGSDVLWHNTEKQFHHSMNLDADSALWIGTKAAASYTDFASGRISYFDDDYLTRVDIESGEITFDKSIAEILVENDLEGLVFGQANQVGQGGEDYDPIHLNDIEPVLQDGPYWKRGDLFVSLRNRSLIFLYRPATNEVVEVMSGPFIHQHDVDIVSDREISLFNNNVSRVGTADLKKMNFEVLRDYEIANSEIVVYNFADQTFRWHLQDLMEREQVVTFTEGLHEILESGDTFIESQNSGKLYLMNSDGVVFRKYLKTGTEGKTEQPNWIRIYEQLPF